jgi:acetolactate synthase-1/2/3 large subunit
MASRETAEAMAKGLADAGVTRMFGVPGGGPNLDLIGAAAALGVEFVLTHGETAACIAAGAYGRLTGTPGAAVVTRGPGLTSAANGLAQATGDRAPLLLVSDSVGARSRRRTGHQRLDQTGASRHLTKWSGTLGGRDPRAVTAAAATLALAGPPGAVHLDVDADVDGDPPPIVPAPPEPSSTELARARALLAGARQPVVVVGTDAAVDVPAVRAALRGFAGPVLVTYQAKGVVPESWPTFAGLFTGAVLERPLLERADLVVGVGLDPVEAIPGPWPYDAPVLLLHSHPVETAYFGAAALATGPYHRVLPAVLPAAAPAWPPGEVARAWVTARARLAPPAGGDALRPQDVVRETRRTLGDGPLTVDAGAHMLVAMPLWATDGPDPVLISNGLATMGYALPAALGAALARPGRRVTCLVGDGGLGMALAELETLARLRLDVTVVVFDDATLSLIAVKQGPDQGGPRAVDYAGIDFATVARGLGVPGTVVEDGKQLRGALADPAPGPRLVDARIDPTDYARVIRIVRG